MKKFIAVLTVITAVYLFSVSVFASEVNIVRAEQTEENGDVTVECSITTDYVMQAITIYAAEYADGDCSKENPIYIDQYVPSFQNGTFSFTFKPMAGIETAQKVYMVRVGGYDIVQPAERIIAFYDGKTYSAGDVDGDGMITSSDAELILKYISGIGTLNGAQLNAADIVVSEDGSLVVDLRDVIEILKNKTE